MFQVIAFLGHCSIIIVKEEERERDFDNHRGGKINSSNLKLGTSQKA
jgi:hypothetical protein